MNILLLLSMGILYFVGINLILQRSLIRSILGILILSNAVNLMLFLKGGIKTGAPPIMTPNEVSLQRAFTDPLPQAFILTSIVISFGIFSFYLALALKTYQQYRQDDLNQMGER